MDTKKIAEIEAKQEHLKWVNKKLKEHFVGIDNIIDDVTDSLEAWYVMPELQMRPTVICLWGMTGVGKTDLVNRLVKLLGWDDSFLKIELGDRTNYFKSILSQLKDQSNIMNGTSGILLFDEIQKFRTVDEDRKEKPDAGYSDFWEMLSDGHIDQRHIIKDIIDTLSAKIRQQEKKKAEKALGENKETRKKGINQSLREIIGGGDDEEDVEEDVDVKIYSYDAEKIIYYLGLDKMHSSDITGIGEKELVEFCKKLLNSSNKHFFDMSKTLVFISGNLDEAYSFAKTVQDADTHADIYHELSKKISFLDIKEALLQRFRAEQIARFGNFHLVYPSLSSKSYKEIIKRRLKTVSNNVLDKHNIDVQYDDSIYKYIYDNGVFPTQGTRPVFSTIQMVVENNLPKILLNCFKTSILNVKLFSEDGKIVAKYGDKTLHIPYVGQIDSIRKKKTLDQLAMVSVHEAGHALAIGKLFGVAPSQISARASKSDVDGFVFMPYIKMSKGNILKKIICALAGRVAEEFYFKDEMISPGAAEDIAHATEMACLMMNDWAMTECKDGIPYRTGTRNFNERGNYIPTQDEMYSDSTFIIRESYKKAQQIIEEHSELLKDLVEILIRDTTISPENFVILCDANGMDNIRVMKDGEEISDSYSDALKVKHDRKN